MIFMGNKHKNSFRYFFKSLDYVNTKSIFFFKAETNTPLVTNYIFDARIMYFN